MRSHRKHPGIPGIFSQNPKFPRRLRSSLFRAFQDFIPSTIPNFWSSQALPGVSLIPKAFYPLSGPWSQKLLKKVHLGVKKFQENQDIFAWNIGIFGYTFLVGEIPHFGLGFIPKFMIFPLFRNPWETSQQFPWKQCPSFQSLPLFPPSQK